MTGTTTNIDGLIDKIDELINTIKGDDNSNSNNTGTTAGNRTQYSTKRLKDKISKQIEDYGKSELEIMKARHQEELSLFDEHSAEYKALQQIHNEEILALQKKHFSEQLNNFKKGWGSITGGFNQLMQVARDVETKINESYGKADQEAVNYSRAIAMNSKELEKLKDNTFKYISDNHFGKLYNITTDEVLKNMGSYNKELGRANRLSNEQLHNMAQLNLLMGETASIKFSTSLDKFGIDIDGAKDMYEEMFNDASSKGIVLTELSESFLNNIDLAQQYTFKDGVEGLKRMTEQAVAVKWNMQQTAAFAEKVSNIEGAVKVGAQLSVLGGPFAQFSNPMGMLYESLNDMEGLQDRLMTMFKNLGSWNNETGQLEVSAYNKQRIKAASQAMGLNYSDVMKTVHSQARREKVFNAIENENFDEKTKELIANTGQIDKNGQAYVTINGEKKYVKDGLNEKDKEILKTQANDQSEDIKDIAITTKSLLETQEAMKAERKNDLTTFINDIGGGQKLKNLYERLADIQKYMLIIQGIVAAIKVLQASYQMGAGAYQMFANRGAISGMVGRGGIGRGGPMVAYNGGTSRLSTVTPAVRARYNSIYGGKMPGGVKAGLSTAGVMGVGVVGSMASMAMDTQASRLAENGNYEDAIKVSKGSRATAGFTGGFSLGMMTGNPLVALALGGIGALGGWIFGGKELEEEKKVKEAEKAEEDKKNKLLEKIRSYGYAISDNYTSSELEAIKNGTANMPLEVLQKIYQYDPAVAYSLPSIPMFGNGGYVSGESHSNGGVLAELEGGEGVIKKEIVEKEKPAVDAMMDGRIVSWETMSEELGVNSHQNEHNNKVQVSFDTLNSNVSGNIRLDLGGYSKEIDGRELLSNPMFISKLRDIIIMEINKTTDLSFKKENYYRKL